MNGERESDAIRAGRRQSQRNAPLQKRKRRRMLNDPSTSGQPSATLFSSCFSALYGFADRAASVPVVDADLAKDGCPPLSPPVLVRHFEILCRPYRRWLPLRPCIYYNIIYTRTVDDKRHRVDENTVGDIARLRLNSVFEEFLTSDTRNLTSLFSARLLEEFYVENNT